MVAYVILPLWSGLKAPKNPSFPLPTPALTHFKIDNEVTTYFRHIDNFLSVLLQLTKVKFLLHKLYRRSSFQRSFGGAMLL